METVKSRSHEQNLDRESKGILDRHASWWKREGTLYAEVRDAPLGDLWLPLSDGTLADEDIVLRPGMLDTERLVGTQRTPGPLEFAGDAICVRSPYVRVPWVEAILGCPIQATIKGGSMRTQAFIADWHDWETRAPHRDNSWLDLLQELTRLLVERSGGRYAVTQTLMRGPTDLVEAVLGPELMCYSMFDSPRALRRFLEEVTEVFIEILRVQLGHIPRVLHGYVNPFGTWASGTIARTQCDASVLLSPNQYAKWFLPYDERISQAVDYSIIHLHSCSLHIVDTLLRVEYPKAIQITLETGPTVPSLSEMLPTFRRMLEHKPVLLDGPLTSAQVDYLLNELPGDGLYIRARQSGW